MRLEIRQMTGEDMPEIKEMLALDINMTGVPELAYVACQDGRIVGVVGYQEIEMDFINKGLELTRLYVDEAYRHRGIAGKMLVHTLALARHHGYVEADLKDASGYFEKLGITQTHNGKLVLNESQDYEYSCCSQTGTNFDQGRREQQ